MITQVKAYWGEASMRARAAGSRPVRCGELKKGLSAPGRVQEKGGPKTSLSCTLKDTCFRTRLIEELDVLCRLAAKYKAVK